MYDRHNGPLAAFILRVALGAMYLSHGLVLKVGIYGMAGTVQFFQSLGLPGWTAYAIVIAETVGGVLLILGVRSREVALAMSPILAGALVVHAGNGWVFSAPNGGWEYPLYLMVLTAVQALLGDGAYALARRGARRGTALQAA